MKIEVKLNLAIVNYLEVGNVYVTETTLKNIRSIFGSNVDNFAELAKIIFISSNFDELEDEDITTALKLIEKDLIKEALKQQYDF